MPTPEQEGPISVEQQPKELSFTEKVISLLKREGIVDEKGEVIGQEKAIIEDGELRVIAQRFLTVENQGERELRGASIEADEWLEEKVKLFEGGRITEEEFDQLETQSLALQTVLLEEWDGEEEVEWERETGRGYGEGGRKRRSP